MPLVGVAELARLLKRDPKAIRFAVSVGRITRRPDGLFDADRAIAEWNANTLHERSHSANKVLEMTPAQLAIETDQARCYAILEAEARRAARPEPNLSVPEWADQNRILTTRSSPRTLAGTTTGRKTRLPKNRTTFPVYFVLPGWPHL